MKLMLLGIPVYGKQLLLQTLRELGFGGALSLCPLNMRLFTSSQVGHYNRRTESVDNLYSDAKVRQLWKCKFTCF